MMKICMYTLCKQNEGLKSMRVYQMEHQEAKKQGERKHTLLNPKKMETVPPFRLTTGILYCATHHNMPHGKPKNPFLKTPGIADLS